MELSGYFHSLLAASWLTLQLALCSLLVGLLLTVLLASAEMSRFPPLRWLTTAVVTIIRGLPELLVVLFIFFGSGQVLSYLTGDYVDISPFVAGVIALSLIFASYGSQTLRGAINAVPRGQAEAARALGLPKLHTFLRITLPQAVRHAIPGLSNQWLVLLKDTALVSLIGVTDLLKQAQLASAATHQTFTWYATAAGVYLIITLVSKRFIRVIDRRFQLREGDMAPR